ncbi:hypothetical protein SK128_005477 [Halocaridina rubra]|uniref:Ig-like domain-containing protein n=1 Tax=Halocaridina rubra TaxID=373956 RepID=A0AAN9AH91_HALRR
MLTGWSIWAYRVDGEKKYRKLWYKRQLPNELQSISLKKKSCDNFLVTIIMSSIMQFTVVKTAVLLLLAYFSASHPLDQQRILGSPVIVNGTAVALKSYQNAFVYCKAEVSTSDNLHHVKIVWQDPAGNIISPWRANARVYVLGTGTHVPHSYLVFQDFTSTHAGMYTCLLKHEGENINTSTIEVQWSSRRT